MILIDTVDELHTSDELGDVVMSAKFPPSLFCTLSQLEHHRQTGFGTAVAFRFAVPESNGGECAFDGIRCADVTPVLSREVEERQQHVSIFGQTFHGRFVLRVEGFFEQIERFSSVIFRWGSPDFMEEILRLRLHTLWHFVEHIGSLVNRTTLLPSTGKHLFQSLPEAQSTVADRQFRCVHQTLRLQAQQNLFPET